MFKDTKIQSDDGIYSALPDDEMEKFRAQRRLRAEESVYSGLSGKEIARIQEKAGSPKTWDEVKKVEYEQ
jgi:hypothetical protein